MPTYDYKCLKCNHCFDDQQKVKNRKKPTKLPCPSCQEKGNIEIVIGIPARADPTRIGLHKPDSGFRDVLSKIRSNHPGHSMKDRWG